MKISQQESLGPRNLIKATSSRQIEETEVSGYSTGTSTITPLSVNQSPGSFSSTVKKRNQVIPYRYKNPDFKHPGPLTIINPYISPIMINENNLRLKLR